MSKDYDTIFSLGVDYDNERAGEGGDGTAERVSRGQVCRA